MQSIEFNKKKSPNENADKAAKEEMKMPGTATIILPLYRPLSDNQVD